eukprot:1822044-Rhodomonas_salina.1
MCSGRRGRERDAMWLCACLQERRARQRHAVRCLRSSEVRQRHTWVTWSLGGTFGGARSTLVLSPEGDFIVIVVEPWRCTHGS